MDCLFVTGLVKKEFCLVVRVSYVHITHYSVIIIVIIIISIIINYHIPSSSSSSSSSSSVFVILYFNIQSVMSHHHVACFWIMNKAYVTSDRPSTYGELKLQKDSSQEHAVQATEGFQVLTMDNVSSAHNHSIVYPSLVFYKFKL